VAVRPFGLKKILQQNMTCGAPSACPCRSVLPVLLHIIVQCVYNGGGRCDVCHVRPVGDERGVGVVGQTV